MLDIKNFRQIFLSKINKHLNKITSLIVYKMFLYIELVYYDVEYFYKYFKRIISM